MWEVGDVVELDRGYCSLDDLDDYGSEGEFDAIYTIVEIDSGDGDLILENSEGLMTNYHRPEWFQSAKPKLIHIGGE